MGCSARGLLTARQTPTEGVRAGARSCARRSGPRTAGGLPAGPPGALRRSCSGWSGAHSVEASASRRSTDARAAGAAVRAQRRGGARAAGSRRDALGGLVGGRPRALLARRLRERHELAGAAGVGGVARALAISRRACRADVRAGGEPAVPDRYLAERALSAERPRAADRAQAHPGCRPDRARGVRRRAGCQRPRIRAHTGGSGSAGVPTGVEPSAAVACDGRSRGRGCRARSSWRSASRCAVAPTERSACTGRWAISCSCSSSTCRDSARGWPATTTHSRRSRSRR